MAERLFEEKKSEAIFFEVDGSCSMFESTT
jgi:hypothetical protein